MRICFVSEGGVQTFLRKGVFEPCDLLVCCFEEGRISYHGELNGQTRLFEDVALLSKSMDNVVVCGVETEGYGQVRRSAIVAQKGKILGIADATRSTEEGVGCGTPLKVFDTKAGRIGVVVADDVYFPEVSHVLCECGAETLVCPMASSFSTKERVLLRATACFYGVPVFCAAKGGGMIADVQAEEAFFAPFSPAYVSFEWGKEYHLVQVRRRGFFSQNKKDG